MRTTMVETNSRKTTLSIVVAIAGGLSLAACGYSADLYTNDPVIDQGQAVKDVPGRIEPFNLDTGCFEAEGDIDEDGKKTCTPAYKQIVSEKNPEKKKELRNSLMFTLMRRSDSNCQVHKAAILYVTSTYNTAATATTGILSGVSAIVTGTLASQVMAATASGITVTQSAINEKMLYNVLAPAIVKEIETLRGDLRSELIRKAKEEYRAFPINLMLGEVERFNQACSFFEGLTQLVARERVPLSFEAIKGRIDDLQKQITNNEETMKKLNKDEPHEAARLHQLQVTNGVLFEALSGLQKRMAGAPVTTIPNATPGADPAKPSSEGAGSGQTQAGQ